MPIYEYYCFDCSLGKERIKPVAQRNYPPSCDSCNAKMELIVSSPSMHVWNTDRSFPNLSGHGNGGMTFATKRNYADYMLANGISEISSDAPKINKPGVVFRKNYG